MNDSDAERAAFAVERQRLVEELSGPDCDIVDARVLEAINRVPRHEFVPGGKRPLAYANIALSIGLGQTISQPYIVAFMTEQLCLKPSDHVLEIGTGSGYQAAVLAELVDEVYTIEIVEPLARRAQAILQHLGCRNVHLRMGDGADGWPEAAPFDAIMVTCAPQRIPPPLVEQLKDDGRLIIPLGQVPAQELVLLHKRHGRLETSAVLPVRFVPMTGAMEQI